MLSQIDATTVPRSRHILVEIELFQESASIISSEIDVIEDHLRKMIEIRSMSLYPVQIKVVWRS